MKPADMKPTEVPAGCRFRTERARLDHVVKHVIDGRDERWHQVLDYEEIAAARDERAKGTVGPAHRALAKRYEEHLARIAYEACDQGVGHVHLSRIVLGIDAKPERATAQEVEAWCAEEALLLAARAPVRSGRLQPYTLRTGYRVLPGIGKRAFRRKIDERLAEKTRLWKLGSDGAVHTTEQLALHDQAPSSEKSR